MTETELNIKHIQERTGLAEDDELIPIILSMIEEVYRSGLAQGELDNTFGLIDENERLNNIINEALKWVKENQYYFPRPDELSKILKGSDKE